MNYLGRKELRAALPELRDLFMRRVDFSATSALGHVLKGSKNFWRRNGRGAEKMANCATESANVQRARWELGKVTIISYWLRIHHSDVRHDYSISLTISGRYKIGSNQRKYTLQGKYCFSSVIHFEFGSETKRKTSTKVYS